MDKKVIAKPDNDKKSNAVVISRALKLIEYFRKNTDSEHPVTQSRMREDEIADYMGTKATFNKMIKYLAKGLDFDDGFLKSDSERRLLFRNFSDLYDEFDEFVDVESLSVRDIYYNHEFTPEEVREIISALRMSRITDTKTAELLIEKIKSELTSKYFKDNSVPIYNKEHIDSEYLRSNLEEIQRAITAKRQLSFTMGFYNDKKKFQPTGSRLKISPDFIITDNGKFYVIGCFENSRNDEKNLAVIRADLISKLKIESEKATSMLNIPALRQITEDKFKTLHLNMSYDELTPVEMKITHRTKDNQVNYNIIHESFGDDFTVLRHEDDGDVIMVRCSKYGIVNWAVQYGDFVEVLAPPKIRNDVRDKLKRLLSKYSEDIIKEGD